MDNSITYIALLRGINVGGYRPLKMQALREMFASMGFDNVSTYIQSGNVVFDAQRASPNELCGKIKNQIEETFGYDVPVIIRSVEELKVIFDQFPFNAKEGWRGYITFLPDQPDQQQKETLEAQSSAIEIFSVGNKVVYSLVNKETNEKPVFSTNFVQKQLDMPVTNRNLRSVQKILSLASSQ